jgi:hypothetical protein
VCARQRETGSSKEESRIDRSKTYYVNLRFGCKIDKGKIDN